MVPASVFYGFFFSNGGGDLSQLAIFDDLLYGFWLGVFALLLHSINCFFYSSWTRHVSMNCKFSSGEFLSEQNFYRTNGSNATPTSAELFKGRLGRRSLQNFVIFWWFTIWVMVLYLCFTLAGLKLRFWLLSSFWLYKQLTWAGNIERENIELTQPLALLCFVFVLGWTLRLGI